MLKVLSLLFFVIGCNFISSTVMNVRNNPILRSRNGQDEKCDTLSGKSLSCDNPMDYPEDDIKATLATSNNFTAYFGKIIHPYKPKISIASRIEGGTLKNLCGTDTLTLRPRKITLQNKNYFIVNTQDFRQEVEYEKCLSNGKDECEGGKLGIRAIGFSYGCEQKFNIVRLVVWTGSKLDLRPFPFPSTCVCSFARSVDELY